MKSTKTYVDYDNDFLKLIKANIDDSYFLEVLYYYIRKALIKCDFNLKDVDGFSLNGRFLGYPKEVLFNKIYATPITSLSLAMSVRAFMLDKKYIKYCYDDRFLFYELNSNYISWNAHQTIMNCIKDDDFCLLYEMICSCKNNNRLIEEQKQLFETNTIKPEYRYKEKYFKTLSGDPDYDGKTIIKNNAFLYNDFEKFVVSQNIEYVGNTAFAYCKNLKEILFEGKVLFGKFPIIECDNLKQIIVPNGLRSYYAECLPYYKSFITEKQNDGCSPQKEEITVNADDPRKDTDELEIEHVYVDIPSAEPYTEIEVPVQEEQTSVTEEEERKPIDVKILHTVFDKVASSYKFFWMMAIISLAKEKHHLTLSFDDITIRMAAMAWPIVFENDIDLGNSDIMKSYLEGVVKNTKLVKGATSNVVENYLKQHYSSQGVDKILSPLMKNVPYRFLSPWIKYTTDAEVIEKSCAKSFNGLYAIHSKYIVLDEEWWEYISANYSDICDYIIRSFITYAKKYNNDMKLVKLMTTGWQLIKN